MRLRAQFFISGLAGWLFLVLGAHTQDSNKGSSDPEIYSIFPLAGHRGTVWQAEVRGKGLDGAYGVWLDCDAIKSAVRNLETIELGTQDQTAPTPAKEGKPRSGQRVFLEFRADSTCLLGWHKLRLISPGGLSNSLSFLVSQEPVVSEGASGAATAAEAQPIHWPVVVNGRVSKEGEVDYFPVEVSARNELSFEVDSVGRNFDPIITLFEPAGSWFDSQRLIRLAYNDDAGPRSPSNDDATPRLAPTAHLTYRFTKAGRYVVAVGAFVGMGGPDFSYCLRIFESSGSEKLPLASAQKSVHPEASGWREREFARKIEPDHLQELWARTVRVSQRKDAPLTPGNDSERPVVVADKKTGAQAALDPASLIAVLSVTREVEPNNQPAEALTVVVPAILEGALERSGDVDHFRIKADASQKLAFEIQTQGEGPPLFSPKLDLLSASGEEVLTNVYQRLGGDGDDWLQSIEPKCVYAFERAGEYTLRMRNLGSRNGSPRFAYRILVRPQIPHVGDIKVKEDRLNLVVGEAKKLALTTGQEEGFDGQIAVAIENLPQGVAVLPAADVEPALGPPLAKVHPERFVPKSQTLTLMLVAREDAPVTRSPQWVQVKAQPIVQGKPGKPFLAQEIPVMVIGSSLTQSNSVDANKP